VLGASVPRIIRLLTRELLILVTAANIVAWPLAYFAMNKWLQNFAFRTNMGIEIFIFAGMLTAVIAVLTLCLKAVKAAQINPVNSLRYE
jgi:putative ABC transport system permease protein